MSQMKAQDDKSQIRLLMTQQQNAWNTGNIREFMQPYWQNDSLKFIGSKGITYGWDNTLNNYLKSYDSPEKMGMLEFTVIEVDQLSANSVFVIGIWQLTRQNPVGGHFTLLWKKMNGEWKIVCDHTS